MRAFASLTWQTLVCFGIATILTLTGCATPPAVKQAAESVDQGYANNLELMTQYRTLAVQVKERQALWSRYVKARSLLISTIKWATTDPVANDTADMASATVDEANEALGPELIALINKARLRDLPARAGSPGNVAFSDGAQTNLDSVIQSIPAFVNAINSKLDQEQASSDADFSGFEVYATNVAALRQINAAIKAYLDVDVTVKPEDLHEITQAIRSLR